MPDGMIAIVLAVLIIAVGAWWRHTANSKPVAPPANPVRSKLKVVQGGLKDSADKPKPFPAEAFKPGDQRLRTQQQRPPGPTSDKDH